MTIFGMWKQMKQECIPVGCVTSAAVAVCWGVCAPSGVCCRGGGGRVGVIIPACTEAAPPPCGQTDRCKNITFATSMRTVTKNFRSDVRVSSLDGISLH